MQMRGLIARLDSGSIICAEGYLFEMERCGYIIAEEAFCALEILQQSGLQTVVTIAPMGENILRDGWSIVDTCKELEQRGADVVGMDCFRGPQTMLPSLRDIRQAVRCHVAGLPVPYRTTEAQTTIFNLEDRNGCTCPAPHGRAFPTALDPLYCYRYEIRAFAEEAYEQGIHYLSVGCGAAPIHIREVAEAMGRRPAASRYAPNMRKHFMYGDDEALPDHMTSHGAKA